jgi:hypothetical protein
MTTKKTKKVKAAVHTGQREVEAVVPPPARPLSVAAAEASSTQGEDLDVNMHPRRMRKLPIDQVQALFRKVIQRDTDSTNARYLIHMIKEARAGRVRIGPAREREKAGEKVHLPLRMNKDNVPVLDAVWERHGMASRSELLRRALHTELSAMGETEAAALFAEPGE